MIWTFTGEIMNQQHIHCFLWCSIASWILFRLILAKLSVLCNCTKVIKDMKIWLVNQQRTRLSWICTFSHTMTIYDYHFRYLDVNEAECSELDLSLHGVLHFQSTFWIYFYISFSHISQEHHLKNFEIFVCLGLFRLVLDRLLYFIMFWGSPLSL